MGSSDWQKGPDTGVFGMRYSEDGEGTARDIPFSKIVQIAISLKGLPEKDRAGSREAAQNHKKEMPEPLRIIHTQRS